MPDAMRTTLRLLDMYRQALQVIAREQANDPAEYADSVLAAGDQRANEHFRHPSII